MIWATVACVYTETQKEFFSCYWAKLPKNVFLQDKADKFYDWRSGEGHLLGSFRRQNRVFRVLTSFYVRRDTRITLFERIRGQKYKKDILPLG